MALTINPCLSTYATGSIGALIFSKGVSGGTVKSFFPPCNPRTRSQTRNRREIFSQAQFLWQNENLPVVRAWQDLAMDCTKVSRLGNIYTPSARQIYCQCQMNLLQAGLPRIVFPPPSLCPSYLPTITVEWTEDGILASWDEEIPSRCAILFYQRRLSRPIRTKNRVGIISHRFLQGTDSPQLLSDGLDGLGGPGSLPPIYDNSWIDVHARTVDRYGRTSCFLFFPIQVYVV